MDSIIVSSKEDMDQIMLWVCKYLSKLPDQDEKIRFDCPFQKGEVLFPYAKARVEFEYEGDGNVRFRPFSTNEWDGKEVLIGGFRWNVGLQVVTGEWYNPELNPKLSAEYQERNQVFLNYAVRWFALMLLAIYYRPEFESKRQVIASKKKKRKSKKGHSPKMLYSRRYVITGSFVDGLPKPARKHAKPEHEYGVRGHYRHYKSGKVAWIHPHTRCKGRKPGESQTYIAKLDDSKTREG